MDKTRYQFLSSLLDKEIEIARNRSLSFTDSRNAFLASVNKSNSPLSSNSRTDQLISSSSLHNHSNPTNHIFKSNSTNQAFTIHDLESQNQRTSASKGNNTNHHLISYINGSSINSSSPRINYKNTQTYPSPDTAQKAMGISSESSFHKEFESIQNKISALEKKMKEGEQQQQNNNPTTITTNNSIASPHFTHPSLQSALNQKNNSAHKYSVSQQSPRFNSYEQNIQNLDEKQKINHNHYDLPRQEIGLEQQNIMGKKRQTPSKDQRESVTKKSPGSARQESGLRSLNYTSKFDGIEQQNDYQEQYISQKAKQTVKRQLEEEYDSRKEKEVDQVEEEEQQQISFENTPSISRNDINNNSYKLFNSKTQQRNKRTSQSQQQQQQSQAILLNSSNPSSVNTKGNRRRPQVDIYDRSSSRKRRSTSRRNRSSQNRNKHIRFVSNKSSERKQQAQIMPSSSSLMNLKNTQTPPKIHQQGESTYNSNQIVNPAASDLYSEETKALQKEYMIWQLKKEKQHIQYQSILEANQRNTERLAALKKQANKLLKQKKIQEEHAEEYDKLFENFERSEAVRQKQKLLIGSLKDELKTLQKVNIQNNTKRNRGS